MLHHYDTEVHLSPMLWALLQDGLLEYGIMPFCRRCLLPLSSR